MHVDLEQGLQRLASNIRFDITNEQKDFILNKIQLRYIKSKIDNFNQSVEFQDKQKHLDDIQKLVERNCVLDSYIDSLIQVNSNSTVDIKEVYSIFPGDYLYLVQDKSLIYKDCHGKDLNSKTNIYKTLHVLPFYYSGLTQLTANPYADLQLSFNGINIFVPKNTINQLSATGTLDKTGQRYLLGYTDSVLNWGSGYPNTKSSFYVINHILEFVNSKATYERPLTIQSENLEIYSIYWQRYNEYYFPNCFLIVTNAPNNVVTTNDFSLLFNNTYSSTSISKILLNNEVFNFDGNYDIVSNRLTKSQYFSDVNSNNVFYKTIPDNPTSTLLDNKLVVQINEKFIVRKTLIDYIRKPRMISLKLNQDCELTISVHPEIVDLSVEYIEKMIKDPDWEIKLNDNIQRGNLN